MQYHRQRSEDMRTVEKQPTEFRRLTSFLDGRTVRSEKEFQIQRSQLVPDSTQRDQRLIRLPDS